MPLLRPATGQTRRPRSARHEAGPQGVPCRAIGRPADQAPADQAHAASGFGCKNPYAME
jgi:hypothetical protein